MPNDPVPDAALWTPDEERDVPETYRAYVRALLARAYTRGKLAEFRKHVPSLDVRAGE